MREFAGIDFGDDCKKYIYELQQNLRKYAAKGRWKSMDNFHLTLKFLDEVDSRQQKTIEEALRGICLQQDPFSIEISEPGTFKGREDIRVLWLGLSGDIEPLQTLAGNIERALAPLGFPPEKRPYTPHITIGQDIVFECPFGQLRDSLGRISFGPIKIEKLTLFKSEQLRNKRVYAAISEFGFK